MSSQRSTSAGARTAGRSSGKQGANVPRDRILHAAAKLFRQQGFKATTARDIARDVGILSGSLFHHFRSKEEMLLEIMRDAAVSICVRAEAIVEQEKAPIDLLRELIRLEFDSMTREVRRDYHGVLFFEWREVPEEAKPEFWRLRKRYQRAWASVLERCAAAGALRCEADATALLLHGALRNAITWYSPKGRYSVDEFGEILLRLFLDSNTTARTGGRS